MLIGIRTKYYSNLRSDRFHFTGGQTGKGISIGIKNDIPGAYMFLFSDWYGNVIIFDADLSNVTGYSDVTWIKTLATGSQAVIGIKKGLIVEGINEAIRIKIEYQSVNVPYFDLIDLGGRIKFGSYVVTEN